MFKLYYCIAHEHNLWLVLLAALVCVITTGSAVFLLRHARAESGARQWIIAAGFASGVGIWATHFVAMLGYDPGIVAGYLPGRTLASLLIAIVMASAGFVLAFHRRDRAGLAAAALLVGGGVSAMHYLGMSAVQFPGHFTFAGGYVLASVLLAVAPVLPALHLVLYGRRMPSAIGGAALLTLAIVLLHFTGMASLAIVPSNAAPDGGLALTPDVMGPLIAAAAVAVLLVTVGAAKVQAARAARAHNTTDAAWAAIGRSNLVIEFGLDGTVQWANDAFLDAMGYTLEEVRGQHHQIFCDPAHAASPAYGAFWKKLAAGDYDAGEYRRVARDGRTVWLRATYNPVLDRNGAPVRVGSSQNLFLSVR